MLSCEPILITGAPRSGTSLVANIVDQAGAVGGIVHKNPGPENATGFYENGLIIERVNKEILWNLGYDPRGQQRLPDHKLQRVNVADIIITILSGQGVKENDTWYFKDPKTLLVYGSYIKSFPNARWLLIRRNTDDIIDSCIRASFLMNRSSVAEWIEYMNHYLGLGEKLKNECPNVREVWYDKIMDDDLDELRSAIDWLGLKFDLDYIAETVISK